MSYKLYYVNYEIGLNIPAVDILCESRGPESADDLPSSESALVLLCVL